MEKIQRVFSEYQNQYEKILSHIYPAKNSTGFPERNLSVNFVKAYEKTAEASGQECVSWFEMQFGENNKYHVDAAIWNLTTRELLVIEAKRLNNPSSKIKEIREDIARIYQFAAELKTQDRLDTNSVQRCYGFILADVWTETKEKNAILHSYRIGQENPNAPDRFLAGLNLPDLHYDVREISAIKNYYLLSFLWNVAL